MAFVVQDYYRCNLVLQNVEEMPMSDEQRSRIAGQLRLYVLFVTLTWFACGRGAIITKTQTVAEARNNKRAPIDEVYGQIISDLAVAKGLPRFGPNRKEAVPLRMRRMHAGKGLFI